MKFRKCQNEFHIKNDEVSEVMDNELEIVMSEVMDNELEIVMQCDECNYTISSFVEESDFFDSDVGLSNE